MDKNSTRIFDSTRIFSLILILKHTFFGLFSLFGVTEMFLTAYFLKLIPAALIVIKRFDRLFSSRRTAALLAATCAAALCAVNGQTPPLTNETKNGIAPNVNFDKEPLFQDTRERTAPPLPSLARPGVASAQILALTLNDAIRIALENNNDIEIARTDVRIAEGTLLSLEGVYDPLLNVTPQYTNSATPITNTIGGAGNNGIVSATGFQFNSSVTKQFRPGGGQYQFFFNNQRTATDATNSRFSPFYLTNFGVTLTQPLLRNFAIDRARRDIRVQQRRVAQSDADFRLRTIEIITQVQQAYWELAFALRDQQNRVDNVNLARQQFADVEARVHEGTTAPLERAEVQTQLSTREAELIAATSNVTIAENTFKNLILRNSLAAQWNASVMPVDQPPFDLQTVSVETALAEARVSRPELQRLRIEKDINNIDLRFFRNQTKPRIDIVSTVGAIGLAGSPAAQLNGGAIGIGGIITPPLANGQTLLIGGDPTANASAFLLQQINQLRQLQGLPPATVPLNNFPDNLNGGYGRSLGNLFSGNARNIVVGVAIELPFGNRTARGNLAVARAQTDRLAATVRQQEQTIESEVRNAVQRLEAARQTVLTARTGRRSAELQVAGERQLYNEGRSTTFLVFQRENDLANTRNIELRAEADYNTAIAALQRATGTSLRVVNVELMLRTPH